MATLADRVMDNGLAVLDTEANVLHLTSDVHSSPLKRRLRVKVARWRLKQLRICGFYRMISSRIDNAIYIQSKTGGHSIQFQQCHNQNLYYLDLKNPDMDKACFFTQINEKRGKAVRRLQEICGSPSDADFIQVLEQK